MECGDRGEGGGCQVTGRWLHRGETYSVPAGGSHHGPVQTPKHYITPWHCHQYTNGIYIEIAGHFRNAGMHLQF